MDTSTSSADLWILPHPIDKQQDRLRLEINITVESKNKRVLRLDLLFVRDVLHEVTETGEVLEQLLFEGLCWLEVLFPEELVGKEIVHVHDLGPALAVTDLVFVLHVNDDFIVAGHDPDKAAAVGGGHADRVADAHLDAVHIDGGDVDDRD